MAANYISSNRSSNFTLHRSTSIRGRRSFRSVRRPNMQASWRNGSGRSTPRSLGVYGFRNRTDHSYNGLSVVNARSIQDLTIWDQVAREGRRANIIGVPPSFPPRKVNGVCIGCFLTPDTGAGRYTHPPGVKDRIKDLVGDYPVDVKGFRTTRKDWLKDEIHEMSRKHFTVVRQMMRETDWDYFQFVEIGLDRLQHGFWKYHDPQHVLHEPGNQYGEVIRDYYRYLDEEVGSLLELLDEETAVLVTSDHGAQRLDGGFCVNEWLVNEGLLVLDQYPREITPFSKLSVNWTRTKVWSEGGYYARVFFNVKGREPSGVIDPGDYEKFRDEIAARFAATEDQHGRLLGTRVYKPDEIYRAVRNVAPDLIVHFGDHYWRSIGGVGYGAVHVQENDTGPDDCNHAQHGGFILSAPGLSAAGEMADVHLLDLAPTMLELGGYDLPNSMQRRSLLSNLGGLGVASAESAGFSADGEAIIRERLSGLGYIS